MCGVFIQSIHVNLNKIDIINLVIVQPLSKKIDQVGNQKHIINFVWPKDERSTSISRKHD